MNKRLEVALRTMGYMCLVKMTSEWSVRWVLFKTSVMVLASSNHLEIEFEDCSWKNTINRGDLGHQGDLEIQRKKSIVYFLSFARIFSYVLLRQFSTLQMNIICSYNMMLYIMFSCIVLKDTKIYHF